MSFKVQPEPDYLVAEDLTPTPDATPSVEGIVFGSTTQTNRNVSLGYGSRLSASSEAENVLLGAYAGGSAGQLQSTVAIGGNAMRSAVYSGTSIAIGSNTARNIDQAQSLIAIGTSAAYSLAGGTNTIAIGTNAMSGITNEGDTGSIAIGNEAMMYADLFEPNIVAIGSYSAKSGQKSGVFIGTYAANTGDHINSIVIGPLAAANATYSNSISIGANAARFTRSIESIAIGSHAGRGPANDQVPATESSFNVAIGSEAHRYIETGSYNVAIGYRAAYYSQTGNNIAIGNMALPATTVGNDNIALGRNALNASTSYGSIWIGAEFTNNSWTSLNNVIVIGYGATPSATTVSDQITLGNSSISVLRCNATTITSLSDARDKTDIKDSSFGLSVIDKLRPVTFSWNKRSGQESPLKDCGFTAQDLMAVEDELDAHDTLRLTLRDNPDSLEASYGRLIPVLVKAIQELSAEVSALKARA